VDFVLEGSARVAGDQVRLITQLIDAKEEGHIWSEEYDRSLTTENLFAVQIEVAEQIAGSMSVVISPEEQARIEARPTNDLEAYELYLIGRHRWTTRSAETMREAISYFEAAIERDSTFALAYSGVADALMVLPFYDLNAEPLDVYGDVKAAVTKALDLDPSLGEIHATVGMMALYYEWDWDAAEHHLQMALEVAPSYPSSHQFYSNLLEARGQYGEAVEELAVALSLDPMSNVLVWEMADALGSVGRTQEARTQFERAIHMEPLIPWALTDYADDLLEAEPVDSARAGELYAEFAAYFGYPHPERVATIVLAIGEGPGAVTDYLALLEDVAEKTVLDRTDLLWFYFPPVPPDVFFDVLEEAAELRHIWVPFTPTVVAQYGQELREDPRWERFLRQIQYPGSPE
jgi:tetratricopeptide (TPR) repeat protein